MKGIEQIDIGIILLWVLGTAAVMMFMQFMYDLISDWYWEWNWRRHHRSESEMFGTLPPPPSPAEKNVLYGCVARYRDGRLFFFDEDAEVTKSEKAGVWSTKEVHGVYILPGNMFPNVKWKDEKPTKVCMTIRKNEI